MTDRPHELRSPALLRWTWVLYAVPMIGALAVVFHLHASGELPVRADSVFASVLPGGVMVASLAFAYRHLGRLHVAALVLWGFLICAYCVLAMPGTSQRLYDTFHLRPELAWKLSRAVVVPMVEEAVKALGVIWAFAFLSRRSWSAGLIYASLVGVGFGAFENIVYYNRGGVSWATAEARLPGTYMHSVFTSCFGVLLGLAWTRGWWMRSCMGVAGWLVATLLHGSSNTITTADKVDVYGHLAAVAWLATFFVIAWLERKQTGAPQPTG